ncbi:MAG: hypothetical protein C0597_10650 [Marinilabiliales bacterium]|nr:MAG: hypothetical protein C0597_10650 [Marinilabiliales bacterium]
MRLLFTLLISISTLASSAQKIQNLKSQQKGGELSLHYDLTGSAEDFFSISVFYTSNNLEWTKLDMAYGDVGDSIRTGNGKKIVLWVDHLKDLKDKMQFKIKAEYYAVDQTKMGNLKDKNGYLYNWIRIGKTKWMAENLKANKTNDNCGAYYNNAGARNECPDGWHLPSDEEWMELELNFGVKPDKVKEHGLREIDLTKLNDAGFIIEECKYKASLYPNQKALAFWTSTENKMLYTGYSEKYFARIIRLDENKISKELRNKSEELNVRCVQSSVYLAEIEASIEASINLNTTGGVTNHPFSGEKIYWQYLGGAIWMKNDIKGSYLYKEAEDQCPTGWRLPVREEWENLLDEYKPGIEAKNENEILHERLGVDGIWGFNLSSNDYCMDINYYTYNTYWINENDKADSRKLREFVSSKRGLIEWVDKQTNEKGKVRCLLDDKDYITKMNDIKTGTFIDKRDKQEYGFVEIENKVWMSDNLNYDLGENSMCRNNIKSDCDLFGHMYNIEVLNNGCPDGWRIPTYEEWKYLLINKAANNLKILFPFGGTGFDLLLGGEMTYDEESKMDTYSAKYLFTTDDKSGYYLINSKGEVEMNEKAKKKDFYYVRCIKK